MAFTFTLFALIGMEIDASPLYWVFLSISVLMKMLEIAMSLRRAEKQIEDRLRKENDDG